MRVIAIDLTRVHDEEITIRWLKSSKETNYILESYREDGPCHLYHYLDYVERYNTVFDPTGAETQHVREQLLLFKNKRRNDPILGVDVGVGIKRFLILFVLCVFLIYLSLFGLCIVI